MVSIVGVSSVNNSYVQTIQLKSRVTINWFYFCFLTIVKEHFASNKIRYASVNGNWCTISFSNSFVKIKSLDVFEMVQSTERCCYVEDVFYFKTFLFENQSSIYTSLLSAIRNYAVVDVLWTFRKAKKKKKQSNAKVFQHISIFFHYY